MLVQVVANCWLLKVQTALKLAKASATGSNPTVAGCLQVDDITNQVLVKSTPGEQANLTAANFRRQTFNRAYKQYIVAFLMWQWPVQVDTIIDQVSAESTPGEQANLAAAKEQSISNPNQAG